MGDGSQWKERKTRTDKRGINVRNELRDEKKGPTQSREDIQGSRGTQIVVVS